MKCRHTIHTFGVSASKTLVSLQFTIGAYPHVGQIGASASKSKRNDQNTCVKFNFRNRIVETVFIYRCAKFKWFILFWWPSFRCGIDNIVRRKQLVKIEFNWTFPIYCFGLLEKKISVQCAYKISNILQHPKSPLNTNCCSMSCWFHFPK